MAGPGEFMCPACGTRNMVRGGAAPDPYGLSPSPSGLTVPGAGPRTAPPPAGPAPGINWETCPACGHRFAMGEVEKVTCPSCRASLDRNEDGVLKPSGP